VAGVDASAEAAEEMGRLGQPLADDLDIAF